jgi:uncharacterized protein YjiS (DUF1127 family)
MLMIELMRRLQDALRSFRRRYRSRQELVHLDERMLHDIGISRSEALHESDKPFWKA